MCRERCLRACDACGTTSVDPARRSIAPGRITFCEVTRLSVLYVADPTPLLNRQYSFRRLHFALAIESPLLKFTRHFTNPWLFVVLAIGYIIGFAFWARAQSFLTPEDAFIGCTATYWPALDACGLNGANCEPFTNSTFDFRCPAQCKSVVLQNPRTVGVEQVDFVPLIVGGGDANGTYRGDSFVCAAAVQAYVGPDLHARILLNGIIICAFIAAL